MSQQVILCVDDEIIVLDALKEQLRKELDPNYIIEIAESGDEALEIFEELSSEGMEFPLVIADFIMPGMKGDEFLEAIHKKNRFIKKIMLTGQASIEGVSNAVNKAGLYRYISKPWDKHDLLLTIQEAIKGYQQENTIYRQNKELQELNATLERKVEERTRQLQEMNATKDKFFSIIAHDLKNPFNTLLGFTELIKDNYESYTSEQIREYMNILYETSRNSYSLLKNLLEWSRSQTGKLENDPAMIDLSDIVEGSVELLSSNAARKGIMVKNQIKVKTLVFADYNMTDTIVRNLISNAIKFTPEKGSIVISCKSDQDQIVCCISDTGIGIPQENQARLFQMDKNFTTKGTANESGTGLGLMLCKEFVEKSKGKIWVESKPGHGSRFYFSLPALPYIQ